MDYYRGRDRGRDKGRDSGRERERGREKERKRYRERKCTHIFSCLSFDQWSFERQRPFSP